jgi:hypothetical protein
MGHINEDSESDTPQKFAGNKENSFCCSETFQSQYPGEKLSEIFNPDFCISVSSD